MISPDLVGGAIGGFLAGFGSAMGLVKLLIGKAIAELRNGLQNDFLTLREADERHREYERRLTTLEARR